MSRPPLTGVRVLVTRPIEQSGPWAQALSAVGAVPVLYPTIEVVSPPSWEPLDRALAQLDTYDWLVFTSANAARATLQRAPCQLTSLRRPAVAVVGAATARAVVAFGVPIARQPSEENQQGLVEALRDLPPGTRVLFPQAVGGREELTRTLRLRGCEVDVVPASRTLPRADMEPAPPFDVATFASPSAFQAFVEKNGVAALGRCPVVAIGPTTEASARAAGVGVVRAASPDVAAILDAITEARRLAPSLPIREHRSDHQGDT